MRYWNNPKIKFPFNNRGVWFVPLVVAAGKTAISAGASAGASSLVSKIFGGSVDKKAANIEADVSPNTQHAIEDFNAIKTGQGIGDDPPKFAGYKKYLSDEEIDALKNAIIPNVQATQGGYYGGLGNSYTSKYTGQTYISVPAIGVAQDIDKYLDGRESIKSTTSQNLDSTKIKVLDYFTQEGLLKKITDSQGNLVYTTTEGQAVATTPAATAKNASGGVNWNYILIGATVLTAFIFLRRR